MLEGLSLSRGNWLLHGWVLTRDSYWTTDALFFALVLPITGVTPRLFNLEPAVLISLTIVVGGVIATRGSKGRAAVAGAVTVAVLLAIPSRAMAEFALAALREPALRECAEHRLARQPNQHRHTVGSQLAQVAQQREIVLQVLAKTESRIHEEAVGGDAGVAARRDTRGEKRAHLAHHVHVVRGKLHGARLALHVHQAHRAAADRGRRQCPRRAQRTHVVDEPGAGGRSR